MGLPLTNLDDSSSSDNLHVRDAAVESSSLDRPNYSQLVYF